jgi:glutathione-regulated potassium-efflux system ancillary protein KefC
LTLAALWFASRMASVTARAVMPTLIANAFYLPRHLLPNGVEETAAVKATRPAE